MSAFDLSSSMESARRRMGEGARGGLRRPRSDRGRSRLDPRALAWVAEAASGRERPPMVELLRRMAENCRKSGVGPPSRAAVYKLFGTLPTRTYRPGNLPRAVRDALYNMGPASEVPGHQVAFSCFNYGDLAAMSFAAGLPWLALYQALLLPGYRARSRGLLEAVAQARGL